MRDPGVDTLSGPIAVAETGAAGDHLLASYPEAENRNAWNELTDRKIIEWAWHCGRVEEEGLEWRLLTDFATVIAEVDAWLATR